MKYFLSSTLKILHVILLFANLQQVLREYDKTYLKKWNYHFKNVLFVECNYRSIEMSSAELI